MPCHDRDCRHDPAISAAIPWDQRYDDRGKKGSVVENVGIMVEPCEAMRSVNKAAVNWRGQLFLNTYDR